MTSTYGIIYPIVSKSYGLRGFASSYDLSLPDLKLIDLQEVIKNSIKQKQLLYYCPAFTNNSAWVRAELIKNKFKAKSSGIGLKNREFFEIWGGEGKIIAIKIRSGKTTIEIRNFNCLFDLTEKETAEIDASEFYVDYMKYASQRKELSEAEYYCIFKVFRGIYFLLAQFWKYPMPYSVGSLVYKDFQEYHKYNFYHYFPALSPQLEKDIRQAYKGGICYVKSIDNEYKDVVSYDRNSAYIYSLCNDDMPWGFPIYFKGKPPCGANGLYIAHIRICARVRQDCLPCLNRRIQIYEGADCIEDTNGMLMDTWVTSVDLETISMSYNVFELKIIEGFIFNSSAKIFNDFLMPYYVKKSESEGVDRYITKTKINSFQGKFSSLRTVINRVPMLNKGMLFFDVKHEQRATSCYLPVAAFITAYGRYYLTVDFNRNRGIYCDTDSIHVSKSDKIQLDISESKLGAWKKEHEFKRVTYIGKKQYIGETEIDVNGRTYNKVELSLSGFPRKCRNNLPSYDEIIAGRTLSYTRLETTKSGLKVTPATYHLITDFERYSEFEKNFKNYRKNN